MNYQNMLVALKAQVTPELVEDIEKLIKKMEKERDNYQNQLLDTRHELVQLDCSYENIKKENEKMIKSMALYETENMAMRELLRLWI